MKKMILTLIAVMVASMYTASMASVEISSGDVRTETRFLTDKMRYELNLDDQQYNDVYEINYDFFYSVRNIMDDVAYGDEYALKTYYDELNIRNDDLRYVLGSDQYEKFINKDYFSRPFYLNNNSWGLEVYFDYGPDVYYYPYPTVYASYSGGHARTSIRVNSYYINRYDHPIFTSVVRYRNNSAIRYMDPPVNTPRYNADNRNNSNRSYNRSGNTRSYSNPSNGSSNSSTRSFTNPYNGSIRSYSNPSNGTNTPSTRSYSNPNNGSSNNNSTRTYSNPSNGTSTPSTRSYSNLNNGSSNNNSTRTYSNPSNVPSTRSYSNPNNGSSNNNSTRTYSNPSNGTSIPSTRSYSNPNNGSSNSNFTRTYSNPSNGGSASPTRIYSRPTVQPARSQPAATNNNVKPNTRSYGNGGSATRK
jgi:hypothetical protein